MRVFTQPLPRGGTDLCENSDEKLSGKNLGHKSLLRINIWTVVFENIEKYEMEIVIPAGLR
jgi:hypothetical protein